MCLEVVIDSILLFQGFYCLYEFCFCDHIYLSFEKNLFSISSIGIFAVMVSMIPIFVFLVPVLVLFVRQVEGAFFCETIAFAANSLANLGNGHTIY